MTLTVTRTILSIRFHINGNTWPNKIIKWLTKSVKLVPGSRWPWKHVHFNWFELNIVSGQVVKHELPYIRIGVQGPLCTCRGETSLMSSDTLLCLSLCATHTMCVVFHSFSSCPHVCITISENEKINIISADTTKNVKASLLSCDG